MYCALESVQYFFVRIFEHDFVGGKEKIRRHTVTFDAVNGKICRKDV